MGEMTGNSPALLRESILADAQREAGSIVLRAQQDAQNILAKATAQADQEREARLGAARAEATRRRELVLARVPVETGRRRSARVELLLRGVHDEAMRQVLAREGVTYREAIVRLAGDAAGRMSGEALVARLAPEDFTQLGAGLAEEITRGAGRPSLRLTIVEDAAIRDGGVIVEDVAGRQIWDNRLRERLERLWPGMRLQAAILLGLAPRPEAGRGGA